MAKDQQANQPQGLGQQGGQPPAYSPGNQWGTPSQYSPFGSTNWTSNNLQGMPSPQGGQPSMMSGQRYNPSAPPPTWADRPRPDGFDPRPFKPWGQDGITPRGPNRPAGPAITNRPASSYPKFQEALGNYFKQNPGSFTQSTQSPPPFRDQVMTNPPYPGRQNTLPFRDQVMLEPPYPTGGQAADPRNAGGLRGPRPSGNRNKVSVPTQDTRNRSRGLAAGIRGRNSGRNGLHSGILQGPSPFGANSPYSRWTR